MFLGIQKGNAAMSFYDLTVNNIDGKATQLSQFKGKVSIVVNTASQCGYTPQYKDLEALYQKYKEKGLIVLGFPSNDFGGQEPGSNEEVKKFCTLKFKTSFPLFSKNSVKGAEKQEVYKFLTEKTDKVIQGEVGWNFEKFLVNKDGKVVARFKSAVTPLNSELESKVQELLK
ncbi:MAG: glutathione peroxidase [Deltaproteobacteria bacterium]|nr:glutathione peroxidase [Deltaproteobacteria bacterium]